MIELSLKKEGEEMMKYFLNKEATTIGRGSHNDICLPDPSISRTHLTIVRQGDQYLATDKSTNGSYVNDEKISTKQLRPNDVIRIGNWTIHFGVSSEQTDRPTQIADRDPTRVLSYKPEKKELTFERAMLEIEGPHPKTFPISKAVVSIGKSTSNDVVLTDEFVSSFHCKIENRMGGFFLKDLSSTNGTLVNGQRVIETPLALNAVIEVGHTRLKFVSSEEVRKLEPSKDQKFEGMISAHPRMREIFTLIERVANSDTTILIQGETGTGKELVAQGIHNRSGRTHKPFVAINCGAISKDLIESELFGHEKGAFTSAISQRKGVFEQANGGTLFLDEIGELPLELQPKLLRVLETGEIKRVGGTQLIDIDVRVIAATHRELGTEVGKGRFREDLFYRLYVVPVKLPPLRDRAQDVPLLVEHFLKLEFASKKDLSPKKMDREAIDKLIDYAWPGNIRELKNVIRRAVLDTTSSSIGPGDLQFAPINIREQTAAEFDGETQARTVTRTLKDVERDRILQELRKHQFNKKETAKSLGIAKSTLHEKIKKYNIAED